MNIRTTGEVAPGRSRHDGDRAVRAGDRGLGLLVGSTVLRITITRSLLDGKLMAQFLVGVGQIILMFIFGALVFNVNLGGSPLGLLLVTLATCWATTSLGILLVAVIRSRKQIHPITTLVILGSSAIGGAWFPQFMMPKLLQQIARITLVGWERAVARERATASSAFHGPGWRWSSWTSRDQCRSPGSSL